MKIMTQKIIYIVEDNLYYAKQVEQFLKTNLKGDFKTKIFPVGEWMELSFELNQKANYVIVDYYLNTKLEDAENGIDLILKLKETSPEVKTILHSAAKEEIMQKYDLEKLKITLIEKNDEAFAEILSFISEE
jgi:response regulator of citrate/malate metabolism